MTHASSSALLGLLQQIQATAQTEPAPAPRAAPQAAPPGKGSTEFTAVDPAAAERYDGNTLMVTAYIVIWVVLMGWILLLWRKQAAIADRLEGLERTLDRAAATAEKKAIKAKAS